MSNILSTKERVLSLLQAGPARRSDIKAVLGITSSVLRTSISRLRDLGWEIICTRLDGGDARYELILPTNSLKGHL